jgi:hypothetical protein
MDAQKVLYFTDGSDVVVTESNFQVKNVIYPLNEIFSHRVTIVLPQRGPFTILTTAGALVFLCGVFDFLPPTNETVSFLGISIIANGLVMALGIAVTLLGMFAMFHLRDKYVVKVSTSMGEKTALVSDKREYVDKITDALNHAHLDLQKKPAAKKRNR